MEYERHEETLDAVSACSDGIVVDLEAPMPGSVRIENTGYTNIYQVRKSHIFYPK